MCIRDSVSSLDYSSPAASGSSSWISETRMITLNNLGLNTGDELFFRWSGNDESGSGSRDEFALDDISISIGGTMSCTEPSSQPTNLVFGSISDDLIQGSFVSTAADKYLVVVSPNSSLGAMPVDGTNYFSGDVLGNGEIVQYSSNTFFTATNLLANTDYYFFIFSANDNCTGGPDYLNNNPLTGMETTAQNNNNGYYSSIGNETCSALKTALFNLINGHTVVSYNSLWTHFQSTYDRINDANNATIVWDLYGDNPSGSETEFTFVTDQCITTNPSEGECYNREHTFPRSWWGGSITVTQYTCLLYTSPSPRDATLSRMPSSA